MSWTEYLHSANWHRAGWLCLGGYLLGCMTAGYYLVRMRTGRDIRECGSGSVGAKNVGRILGKGGFLLTVFFDFGKGVLAVWAARSLTGDDHVAAMVMLAVVAGHIWPAQLRFHGGKGMATSLGALMTLDPQMAFVFAVVFLGLYLCLNKTVIPGLAALAIVPLAAVGAGADSLMAVLYSALAFLVLVAHRKNLVEEFSQFMARRHAHPKPDQS